MLCPYCGEEKEGSSFTDEHVLPRALGGALEPTNPFKLRICRRCNEICGRYMDAPVVRSWLLRLGRAGTLINVHDPHAGPLLLQFMGPVIGWSDPDTVCDLWLGPTGDSVFHFHAPYTLEATMVGGAPGHGEHDPGVVLLGIVASNPEWHPIIVRSVKATFDGAPIFGLNFAPRPPKEYERHQAWIDALPREKETNLSLDLACGERFTAKMGLGLGAIVLGPEYATSSDAASLRAYMRSADPVFRASLGLRGKALLGVPREGDEQVHTMFGWGACHTIALLPMGDVLTLIVLLYGTHTMVVTVASQRSTWAHRVREGGLGWVIAPGLRRYAHAPLSHLLVDIAAESPVGVLAELHSRIMAVPPRPPVHLAAKP
jgi:hypothetical protein